MHPISQHSKAFEAGGRHLAVKRLSEQVFYCALGLVLAVTVVACDSKPSTPELLGPFLEEPLIGTTELPEQTDAISSDTEVIYFAAVVPGTAVPQGIVDARLIAVDPAPFLPENSIIVTQTINVHQLDEWWTFGIHGSHPWPPGAWRLELMHEGGIVLSSDFDIAGDAVTRLAFMQEEPVTTATSTVWLTWYQPFCDPTQSMQFGLVAVDLGPLAAPGTEVATTDYQPTNTIETGTLSFQESMGFPAGTYRAEARQGTNIFGQLEFEVTGETPQLVYGPVLEVILGATDRVDPISTATELFYVPWGAPFHETASQFSARLIAVEVEGVEANTEVQALEASIGDVGSYGLLEIAHPLDAPWQAGSYRVEVLRDNQVIGHTDFVIQAAP